MKIRFPIPKALLSLKAAFGLQVIAWSFNLFTTVSFFASPGLFKGLVWAVGLWLCIVSLRGVMGWIGKLEDRDFKHFAMFCMIDDAGMADEFGDFLARAHEKACAACEVEKA